LSLPQLERNIHPVVIISAFKRALADALAVIQDVSVPVDTSNDKQMTALISSSIGTKFVSRWSDMMCHLALTAVRTVSHNAGGGKQEVDIKRYARVEKIPGGEIEDSVVLDGVMLNKDITHPKMRRRIENPRIVLLDCTLEYKKGESQTNVEISKEEDWNRILQIEEEQVKSMCDAIIAVKPDLVITEKGVSGTCATHICHAITNIFGQTLHNIISSKPTSQHFAEYARQITTVLHARQVLPLLTTCKTYKHPTSERSVVSSRSQRLATSTLPFSQSAKTPKLALSFSEAHQRIS
jgi:chaperonin GroEL (HSP60 family)